EAFSTLAAMADEIGLETAGANVLPLAEGADGDLGREGGMAGAGGGEAMGMVSPMRAQETINRRGANAQEGRAQGGRDLEYLVVLEGLDEGGQERGEAFAAEIVAGFPDAVQERDHLRAVGCRSAWPRRRPARALAEEANGRLTMPPREAAELG